MSEIFFEMHQKLEWLDDDEGMDRVQSIIKWKWLNQGSRYMVFITKFFQLCCLKFFIIRFFWEMP